MYFDFSNYPLSNIRYGGSERKLGILIITQFEKETIIFLNI